MARLPRYVVPGMPQHIVQRGNNRSTVFFEDNDYGFYRYWLRTYAERFKCQIHAYVLMGNHVHLLLTPTERNGMSRFMQCLGRRYVGYVNDRHGRTGGLWEGRYFATIIETERYLLNCYRYVELNPVRAGLVPNPADYLWSSHRSNALGEADGIVVPHDLYRALGRDRTGRLCTYRHLFDDQLSDECLEEIRAATRGGWALGGKHFAEEMAKRSGRRAARLPRGGDRKSPRFKGV